MEFYCAHSSDGKKGNDYTIEQRLTSLEGVMHQRLSSLESQVPSTYVRYGTYVRNYLCRTPCVLIRGFAPTWQEQQVPLALFDFIRAFDLLFLAFVRKGSPQEISIP